MFKGVSSIGLHVMQVSLQIVQRVILKSLKYWREAEITPVKSIMDIMLNVTEGVKMKHNF